MRREGSWAGERSLHRENQTERQRHRGRANTHTHTMSWIWRPRREVKTLGQVGQAVQRTTQADPCLPMGVWLHPPTLRTRLRHCRGQQGPLASLNVQLKPGLMYGDGPRCQGLAGSCTRGRGHSAFLAHSHVFTHFTASYIASLITHTSPHTCSGAHTHLHTLLPSKEQAPKHRSPAWTSPFLSLPWGPWAAAPRGEAFHSASPASSVSIPSSLMLSPELRKALSSSACYLNAIACTVSSDKELTTSPESSFKKNVSRQLRLLES